MNITPQQLSDYVREIAIFCLSHKGRCFTGWSGKKVFKYLAFHFLAGTMVIAKKENEICCVAIGWPVDEEEIYRRHVEGLPQFNWQLPPPGNCLLIAEVFGDRKSAAATWAAALKRFPFIVKAFTYRQRPWTNKLMLKEFTTEQINRFMQSKWEVKIVNGS